MTSLACSDDDGEDKSTSLNARAVERDPAEEAAARVEAFVAAPDWSGLIALLGQSHQVARELLGPHHLHYTASFYTGPAEVPRDQPLPDVAVDTPIFERFVVDDQLDLRWAAAPGQPPKFQLDQRGGEPGSARGLIVIDEQAWTQLDDRGWLARPLETDLWTVWLDDAQHAVLDVVVLAGPQAEIDGPEAIDVGGRPALRIGLRRGDTPHPERVVEAPTAWRGDASIDTISGEIVLDRATGSWLSAALEVTWHFDDSAGREVRGSVELDGRLDVLGVPPVITAPATAQPLPERERPEILRERLLDGLAAP